MAGQLPGFFSDPLQAGGIGLLKGELFDRPAQDRATKMDALTAMYGIPVGVKPTMHTYGFPGVESAEKYAFAAADTQQKQNQIDAYNKRTGAMGKGGLADLGGGGGDMLAEGQSLPAWFLMG